MLFLDILRYFVFLFFTHRMTNLKFDTNYDEKCVFHFGWKMVSMTIILVFFTNFQVTEKYCSIL